MGTPNHGIDIRALFKPVLYAVDGKAKPRRSQVVALVDLCAEQIVMDSSATKTAVQNSPIDVFYPLMQAALHLGRDLPIAVLLSNWPHPVLRLRDFAPDHFSSIKMLYNNSYMDHQMKTAVKFTTCLAHTFIDCLKNHQCKLKCLDLTGFPTVQIMINYLASHVLLVHNEQRQNEIIAMYNEATKSIATENKREYIIDHTLKNNQAVVMVDAHIEAEMAYLELCRAVQSCDGARFSICLRGLCLTAVGVPKLVVLLELVNPMFLQSLSIPYNFLPAAGLVHLAPVLGKFIHLQVLDLSCNNMPISIDHTALENLRCILSSLPNLTRLNLSNNRLRGSLGSVLNCLPPTGLQYLGLCACCLVEHDYQALVNNGHLLTLKHIDLSCNTLTDTRLQLVRSVVTATQSLEILELSDCTIADSAALESVLITCSVTCQNLHYLSLHDNEPINFSSLSSAIRTITDTPRLEAVVLPMPHDVPQGCEDSEAFTQGIQQLVRDLCLQQDRHVVEIKFVDRRYEI